MTTLFAVFAIVSCSGAVLGQLSCDPGVKFGPRATCRSIGKREEHCETRHVCFDPCFDKEDRVVPDTCSRCNKCKCSGSSISNTNVSVTYRLMPLKFNYFNLSVQLPAVSGVEYTLQLKKSPYSSTVCYCTSDTSFNFTFQYPTSDRELTLKVKSSSAGQVFDRKIKYPRHCGDTERGMPYDQKICGWPRLQKPRNVVLQCNETHTYISWNKTISYVRPDNHQQKYIESKKFYLVVELSDNRELTFVVSNASSVTLNTTAAMNITLYGYKTCSGLIDWTLRSLPAVGVSLPFHASNRAPGTCCGNSTCNKISSATVVVAPPVYTTPPPMFLPTKSNPKANHIPIAVWIATGVVIAVLVPAVILVFAVSVVKKRRKTTFSEKVSPYTSALVVYSPSTPEQEKLDIMQCFAKVRCLTSGIKLFLQDERSPQQSLSDWILEHHKNASIVFCVCNKEFECEWDNKSEESVAAVHIIKMLFQGDCCPEKYAVVLSKPEDKVFIPASLKALPRINLADTSSFTKCSVQ